MWKSGHRREQHRISPSGMSSIIGRDIAAEQAALRNIGLLLALGGAAVWLAGLGGGWWLAGRALKPIDTIGRTASRIAAGNLDERIEIARTDNELDQLGGVLNDTFDRLAAAIERQKRFTADASHELRTPVTIILSETQRALKREREPEQYREILANCRTAAERMRALVESLLVLARQDLPSSGTEPVACDLAEIAGGVADLLQPLADEHSIAIHRELSPAPLDGDPHSLAMVVQNLLSNAIVHPPSGSKVVLENDDHRRLRDPRSQRQRPRHRRRAPAPPLRPLLPRRLRPRPGQRPHRPRPRHREDHRRKPRRQDRGRKRQRHHVPRDPAHV